MGGVSVAEYRFQLAAVTVVIARNTGPHGARFSAVVTDAGGQVIGEGQGHSEPAAVGLAILAAGQTRGICNGCGQWFDRAELRQDAAADWYCGDCLTFGHWRGVRT
jgi:hypothetical protein